MRQPREKRGKFTYGRTGKPPKYDHVRMESLIRSGKTDREVAGIIGCVHTYAARVRRELGIPSNRRTYAAIRRVDK